MLTANSSAQQWRTTLEISYPAALSLPAEISNILLVNNTVAHPDAPLGAFYTLMAASEMLEGSDLVPSVLEVTQNNSPSLYRKQLLNSDRADSLLTAYESDALLVLNQLIVHPTTESYETDDETFYAYTRAIAATHWTLFFRPGQGGAGELSSRALVYSDTLYWENEAYTYDQAIAALPDKQNVISEICIYAGEQIAARLMPTTETEDRYLYDLGEQDQGMYYFTRRQWQQAADAWLQPQSDTKRSAYAAANRAVALEILGDLGGAYAAAGEALNAFESLRSADARQQAVNIRYYQGRLQARMAR